MLSYGTYHRERIGQNMVMNDISTDEVDSGICWVSKDQKSFAKNEVVCSTNINPKSNKLKNASKTPLFWADFLISL